MTTENQYRDLGNYLRSDKDVYIKAAELSGQKVTWSDDATPQLTGDLRNDYGSLWSDVPDLSVFWRFVADLRRDV